ncbi:hypothetical protein V1264_024591 [Littorina saxatilis]|uniref:Uncharacterized protein n=1 Tax=Littorina saxatilis TaxID=31220 RepID=A0AAN9AMG4_9CAEN
MRVALSIALAALALLVADGAVLKRQNQPQRRRRDAAEHENGVMEGSETRAVEERPLLGKLTLPGIIM